ncbi:MAG: phosphoenolpyruvate--protein phosphotransferase [Gorillibacterium sp.]|nr:phosphoenolpyruvate--protein phosphotransferase [Gorillibacterium sp.]
MTIQLKGIAASPGIAIATVLRLEKDDYVPVATAVEDTTAEQARFRLAVTLASEETEQLRKQTAERMSTEKAEIFEAHLLVLEDPEFIDVILEKINDERVNAEFVLQEVAQTFIDILQGMDDTLLQQRATDVADVRNRIMNALRGKKQTADTLANINEDTILVASDLTPSDTVRLNLDYIRAIVTEVGSRTSHTAIMARSLEIPAIVGVGLGLAEVKDGTTVIVDAIEGVLLVNPTEAEVVDYQAQKRNYEERRKVLRLLVNEPTLSRDGKQVQLAANIGSVADVSKALANGAEGIGLFRTEFLYMGRATMPTEEEQFRVYSHVLEQMQGKPVVIRTLDIGGDKKLPYLPLPFEENPFLGLRAIRLCLDREDLFRSQLRALLRASVYGQLKIMFPMIAIVEELRKAKLILQEEKDKLLAEGIAVADAFEIGIMIEVPAAALAADSLAKEVDFFSIGTNDLIQYTMAADRMNESISYLYQPTHPSILRLVRMVIDAANEEGRWVGMCGEMAGDESAIPILLGLGLHEFSMSASSILPARAQIADLSQADWSLHAEKMLRMGSSRDVKAYARSLTDNIVTE